MSTARRTKQVPESHRDLLERPLLLVLGTTAPDGTPRVTPIWFNYEEGFLFLNSAPDCAKHRAMQAHPYVSMVVIDPDNPFRYIAMHGPVVEITEKGAREHNDRLAKRYLDLDKFPGPEDEIRMTYKIAITSVAAKG